MHAVKLLHNNLKTSCPTIHSKRLNILIKATQTLSENQRLSITELGRDLKSSAYTKHNIKRIDRLVGNEQLHLERKAIYRVMTQWLVGAVKHPIILVDWSDLTADREHHLLRAAIPIGGRSLTLYEEVHPMSLYGNRKVHRAFLQVLKELLPVDTQPIIVTDAGFRAPWFQAVDDLNWLFVGRVRNREYVLLEGHDDWESSKTLYKYVSSHPKRLGYAQLSRSNPTSVVFHVVKKAKRGRVKKSLFGLPVHNARSNKCAGREREPWLIAVSPSMGTFSAKRIIAIYSKRMEIEEGFRDIKCQRFGLGLSNSLSKIPERLENLLLLGALALLVIWLTGTVAMMTRCHHQFQSNTLRKRRVLSVTFVGMLVLRKSPPGVTRKQLAASIFIARRKFDCAFV